MDQLGGRVGVYLCQPGTQRHAWILNTGGVTTTNKYYKLTNGDGCHSCELQSTLRQTLSCSMYPQGRVGMYLRQPGTQRHARIWNTGDVTTTKKYLQSDQWRWVSFLVGVYLCQPGTQRHARIQNTGGVTTTNKSFSSQLISGDGCHS
ncbi:hypothetical protein EMCRGX_G018022 [Ephydatia muelleri]